MFAFNVVYLVVALEIVVASSSASVPEAKGEKKPELWQAVLEAAAKLRRDNKEIDTQSVKAALPQSLLPKRRLSKAEEGKMRTQVLKAIKTFLPSNNETDLTAMLSVLANPVFVVEEDGQVSRGYHEDFARDFVESNKEEGHFLWAKRLEVIAPKIEFLDAETAVATFTLRFVMPTPALTDEGKVWTIWHRQQGQWKLVIVVTTIEGDLSPRH